MRSGFGFVLVFITAFAFGQDFNPLPKKGYYEVPFEFKDDAIVVQATLNGEVTGRFVFDTGFAGYITVGDRLNIGEPTGTSSFISHTGVGTRPSFTLRKLQLGDLVITRKIEAMQDDSHYTQEGEPVDGLIGLSCWWEYVLEINYQEKKLRMYPRASKDLTKMKADNKTSWLMPFEPTSGAFFIFVPMTINGITGKVIFDTGAQGFFAVLYQHSGEKWKLLVDKPKYVGQGMDASGVHDEYEVYLKDIKIGPISIPRAYATILAVKSTSQESDGALGSKFLENHNIWIDFRGRQLFLQRWKDVDYMPTEGDTGAYVGLHPSTHKFEVWFVMKGSPADAAGIKKGDLVLMVNNKQANAANQKYLRTIRKGPAGEKVKYLLERDGRSKLYEVERKVMVNGDPPPTPKSDSASAKSP